MSTSSQGTLKGLSLFAAAAVAAWVFAAGAVCAVDVPGTDALVKRADTELRAAERKLFGGDKEGALQQLATVGELLASIEQADPNRRELATLKQKQARLQTDLDRRLGKTAGTAAKPATAEPAAQPVAERAPAATPAPRPAAAGAKPAKLPYQAREKLTEFAKLQRSAENKLTKMEEAKHGETTVAPEKYAEEFKALLANMKQLLAEAKTVAADGGVVADPALDEAQGLLDALPGRLQQMQSGVAAAQATRASSAAGLAADIEQLTKAYERLREAVFEKASGAVMHYNDLEPVRKQLAAIESFEKEELAKTKALLAAFSAKYGATDEEIRQKTDDNAAARVWKNLTEGVANVAKTRTAMAEDLAGRIAMRVEGLDGAHDFFRLERHAEVREWTKVAQQFDAENAKVKEVAGNLERQLADDAKKMGAKIEARTWPAHAANAPDNARKLASTAVDWFKASPDWGRRDQNAQAKNKEPYEILAVAVTGPWSVQARNIAGAPTMYGLPVRLAVQVPSEKKANVARVYSLTLCTRELAGVKAEPPFDSVTVGDSLYIRPSAVK